jgi:hypothetical protein
MLPFLTDPLVARLFQANVSDIRIYAEKGRGRCSVSIFDTLRSMCSEPVSE